MKSLISTRPPTVEAYRRFGQFLLGHGVCAAHDGRQRREKLDTTGVASRHHRRLPGALHLGLQRLWHLAAYEYGIGMLGAKAEPAVEVPAWERKGADGSTRCLAFTRKKRPLRTLVGSM